MSTDSLAIVYDSRGQTDGIGHYCDRLCEGFREIGIEAQRTRLGDRESRPRGTTVLLQYNPFSFGRRGWAPWVVRALRRLRREDPSARIGVMAHEAFVEPTDTGTLVLSLLHRWQFRAIRGATDLAIAPSRASAQRSGCDFVVPVGSNLPDRRHDRASARADLAAGDETTVLTIFSGSSSSLSASHLERAWAAIDRSGPRPVVLVLGSAPLIAQPPPGVRVVAPGVLPAAEVARLLGASDLFVAPYVDGATTRRTTLMAALQHGLTVVTTVSPLPDAALDQAGVMACCSIEDAEGFAREAARLTLDAPSRVQYGRAARRCFDDHFTWPRIAAAFAGHLGLRTSA